MLALHTIPDAFSIIECKQIAAALANVACQDALRVGQTQNHELRKADLVWIDDFAARNTALTYGLGAWSRLSSNDVGEYD